jgi:hypothetical protein
MSLPSQTPIALSTLLLCALVGCHTSKDSKPSDAGPSGGPEAYSAMVVRTTNSGGLQQTEQSRVAISGGLSREEWTEQGERLALILRPDLGKSYLLWLDKGTYTESSLGSNTADGPVDKTASKRTLQPGAPAKRTNVGNDAPEPEASSATPDQGVADWAFEDAVQPLRTEQRELPAETIDNHNCRVTEQLAYFADGHSERTVTYRATDFEGLALRIESESGSGADHSTVLTERHNIRLEVSPDEFSVPAALKRIERAPAP